MIRIAALVLILTAWACGNNPPVDAGGDGPCGGDLSFTGELVDWDSTDANFCGVFGATMTVHGDASRTDSTNPNGRFGLCLKHAATTQVDIAPPAAMSQCVSNGIYQLPAIVIANQAVISSGKTYSARMITMARLMPFFTGLGVTYDASKAIVFVHVEGTAAVVTSSAAHDTALAWDGAAWSAGSTGVNVVFPNTDVTGGTTMIAMPMSVGAGSVPVAAGTITYVTLASN